MKLVKLKKVAEDLGLLREQYDELRDLIADQVRDNEIKEAKENLEKLDSLIEAIEQMKNLDVQVG